MLHRRAFAASAAALVLTLPLAVAAYGAGPSDGVPNQVPLTSWPKIGGAKVGGKNVAVEALTQVGNTIVAGGNFTTVGGASRPYIAAFDATTGAVKSSFSPTLDGEVLALAPGLDGQSVYVGGRFKKANGVNAKSLTLLRLSDGKTVPGFKVPVVSGVQTNGIIQEIKTDPTRAELYVGGTFTKIGGQARGGLASLNPSTGTVDGSLIVTLAGHHKPGAKHPGAVGAQSFDVTPNGQTMVVTGNFTSVNGIAHDQIVELALNGTGGAVKSWTSLSFTDPCGDAFDSWIRQVRISPDGTYFVVVSTGAQSSPTLLCDSAGRFDVDGNGSPVWIANDGQDSIWSVAVTDAAVYVGGHFRWFNNANGHNAANAGAVPRPGIAALDPDTGLPLDWNPGHHPRGIGITALLATDNAVYVGSDQDFWGLTAAGKPNARNTGRLGVLPFATGRTVMRPTAAQVPGTAYLVKNGSLVARSFNGSTAGTDSAVSSSIPWGSVHGGFILGGQLWYFTNGALNRAAIAGNSVGSSSVVNPYDNGWDNVWTQDYDSNGNKVYYKGAPPTLYNVISKLTGVAYGGNRIYYTETGKTKLFYRWFTADSGVIGAVEKSVSAGWASSVKGMFISGNTLYFTKADGKLYKVGFNPATAKLSGSPVVASATTTWTTAGGVLLLGN